MTYVDRPAPLIRRDPASEYDLPPSPPKLTARDHVRLFVQAAVAMLVVVAVLLACAWIGAR